MRRLILSLLLIVPLSLAAQKSLLQSGPMLGYLTMHEVMFWVQTKEPAKVKIAYYIEGSNEKNWTNEVNTSKEEAYTAHLIGDKLVPGKKYKYELYINGKKVNLPYPTEFKTKTIWKYHTNPPTFSFAAGSGTYVNDPEWDRAGHEYGGRYDIYRTIYKMHPDFMIWLGDNVYLRQNEWNSWTGTVYRYTHDRSIPEMQPLLANVFNYAIWDDHDFGPNNSDGSFPFKDMTLKAFKTFWANPSYGVNDLDAAITFFNWGDVDFFLLDNRMFRDPDDLKTDEYKTMLGKEQLEWLEKALVASRATFKVVVMGGQFLNPVAKYETYSNYGFDKERQALIDFIYDQNLKNVVFLTGDRHHTELSILKKDGKPTIYDITLSPFNSRPNKSAVNENNTLRVPGTIVVERNFGIITFSGKRHERVMDIKVYNADGKLLWEKSYKEE